MRRTLVILGAGYLARFIRLIHHDRYSDVRFTSRSPAVNLSDVSIDRRILFDLSQPETIAIRILPLLMIGSQFVLQKMTPSTTTDPAQKNMMLFLPLVMGFMFYGVSSGLVLYWLTGNVVGIVQQYFINRAMPTPAPAATVTVKPASKRTARK